MVNRSTQIKSIKKRKVSSFRRIHNHEGGKIKPDIKYYEGNQTIDNRGKRISITMVNGNVVQTVFCGYNENKMKTSDLGEIDLSDIKRSSPSNNKRGYQSVDTVM
jgi:hypothetical protein